MEEVETRRSDALLKQGVGECRGERCWWVGNHLLHRRPQKGRSQGATCSRAREMRASPSACKGNTRPTSGAESVDIVEQRSRVHKRWSGRGHWLSYDGQELVTKQKE